MIDLKEALTEAQSWARQAGKIQLEKWHSQNLKIETKSSVVDLVTEADKLSESCIIANIREKYPSIEFCQKKLALNKANQIFFG